MATILVVDDDEPWQASVRSLLESGGYRAVCVSNGREALDYLAVEEAPALILLDWRMPVMGGGEFREAQLRAPALRTIPVLLASADVDLGSKAEQLGVPHLAKPMDEAELLDAVRRYANR